MPKFLRFKQDAMRCLEIDISKLNVLQIEITDDGEYCLFAYSDTQMFDLCYGTMDECHMMLNEIHDALGVKVIDL